MKINGQIEMERSKNASLLDYRHISYLVTYILIEGVRTAYLKMV
jgi:hypothetical protein